jgi:peptidoglycan/LPS O-acetylase OafA/YrhL
VTIDPISPYLRGIAITGVFVENYLSWIGVNAPGPGLAWFIRYIQFFGASLVHIFFVLSGYGLVAKYQECSRFPWKAYAANRFAMIVVPYWIVVTASYLFINLLHGWDPGPSGPSSARPTCWPTCFS